ncbi:MAG: hypothetical protein AABW50_05525 [Nanoarchaeota archaeon]
MESDELRESVKNLLPRYSQMSLSRNPDYVFELRLSLNKSDRVNRSIVGQQHYLVPGQPILDLMNLIKSNSSEGAIQNFYRSLKNSQFNIEDPNGGYFRLSGDGTARFKIRGNLKSLEGHVIDRVFPFGEKVNIQREKKIILAKSGDVPVSYSRESNLSSKKKKFDKKEFDERYKHLFRRIF